MEGRNVLRHVAEGNFVLVTNNAGDYADYINAAAPRQPGHYCPHRQRMMQQNEIALTPSEISFHSDIYIKICWEFGGQSMMDQYRASVS